MPPGVDAREKELKDAQSALVNILEDFAGEERRLKDTQSAVLNILEDSAADRLAAEAAFKASVNILSDLSDAEAEVRTLNAELEVRVALRTAELERVNKNLEAFAYSVSHDLRTPLRALSGFSDALVEDYGDRLDETGRGYAGSIKAASERMAALIDDLLLLSQVSRAGMNLQPVDLSAEAAAIAGELQGRDPGRAVRFIIQDGVRVIADRSLIRTVLQNLLENAWKFTAHRDGAVIEFATAAAEDGGVCCYVRDNGAGFDPAYAGKLFQPFERLHDATEFPGTGIGLASVARIIERHGGRTWADGAVGHGATFSFTLTAEDPALKWRACGGAAVTCAARACPAAWSRAWSRRRIGGCRLPAGGGEFLAGAAHGLFGGGQLAEAGQALRSEQLIFQLGQIRPLLGLGEGPLDGRRQARRPVLQDVVRGSLLDEADGCFVAEHAGPDDERNVRALFLSDPEGHLAGEAGQMEIGQDDVWPEGRQLLDERRPGVDDDGGEVEARAGQEALREFSIPGLVLQDEDACRPSRGVRLFPRARWSPGRDRRSSPARCLRAHRAWNSLLLTPHSGTASFRSSQNRPSVLIASANSAKFTGFRT